jgi:hypothetical protein
MLLTKFCKKPEPTAYDKLVNEIGYFDAPEKQQTAKPAATQAVKKLMWKNIPQTPEALVARLHADKARVETMSDAIGAQIVRESIASLEAFLTANNIAF